MNNTKCILCGQAYEYKKFEKHLMECKKFAHMKYLPVIKIGSKK